MKPSLVLVVAILSINGCSSAGGANAKGDDTKYTIVVNGAVGDTYSYSLLTHMEAVGAEGTMGFKTTFVEKLAKVDAGVYEWVTSFGKIEAYSTGVMAGGDVSFKQMESIVMTSVQDDRGTVKTLKFGDIEIPSKGSSNVVLPPPSARIGDTWKANVDISGNVYVVEYRLESVEKVEGRLTAKISGSYAPGDPIKSIEPPSFLIDAETGKMLSGKSILEVTVDGKTIRITYEIKRV